MHLRIPATFAAAALALSPATPRAHHAPGGWDYPMGCCGGDTTGQTQRGDCAPIPAEAVKETRRNGVLGYAVTVTGSMRHPSVRHDASPVAEFVPIGDQRINPSPDGEHHVCLRHYEPRSILCVFIPPGGA